MMFPVALASVFIDVAPWVAAGLVGFGLFFAFRRFVSAGAETRRRARFAGSGPVRETSEYWETPDVSDDDRRSKLRRRGNPTPVELFDIGGNNQFDGCVMDRHSAGLHVTVPKPLAIGSKLRIIAKNAPVETPWAEATVCWCKREKKIVEVGLKFTEPLAPNVFLLFG